MFPDNIGRKGIAGIVIGLLASAIVVMIVSAMWGVDGSKIAFAFILAMFVFILYSKIRSDVKRSQDRYYSERVGAPFKPSE